MFFVHLCHGSSHLRLWATVGKQLVGRSLYISVTVAQLVEHGTHKPGVAGSIPARDTT